MVVMLHFSKVLWDICRLKSSPQKIPSSTYLLILTVIAGIIIDGFASSIFLPDLSGLNIIYIIVLYNVVLLTAVYLLLKVIGHAERGIQTITAMAGAGFLISLVLLPALLMLNTSTEEVKPFGLLILFDNLWRIVVNAHIFRHAFSISLLMAMIISMSYLLFGMLVAEFLLPIQGH